MKALITRCVVPGGVSTELVEQVRVMVRANGFQVDLLDLPHPDDTSPLKSLLAIRLIPVGSADVLLCLDAWSAALRHSNKRVWLLGGVADVTDQADFLANVLRAGVREARSVFAPAEAAQKLKDAGFGKVGKLAADVLEVDKSTQSSRTRRLTPLLKTMR